MGLRLRLFCDSTTKTSIPKLQTFICGKERNLYPPGEVDRFMALYRRSREMDGDLFSKGMDFYSYFNMSDGYGQSANLFLKGLLDSGFQNPLYLHEMGANVDDAEKNSLPEVRERCTVINKNIKYPLPNISLAFTLPIDAHRVSLTPKIVGFTMWETTRFPLNWYAFFETFDWNFVPSQFCHDVIRDWGYTGGLTVQHLPVSPMFAPWKDRVLHDPYTFLFVSSPVLRKGIFPLVDGFQSAFKENDDVRLRIHARRWGTFQNPVEADLYARAEKDKRIIVTTHVMTDEELLALYRECDCLLHPSMGEGFGLTPLQAICSGMPTIYTNATGMTEFNEFGLPVQMKQWVEPVEKYFKAIPQGMFAEIDQDKFIHAMQSVFEHPEPVLTTAQREAPRAYEKFNYIRQSQILLENLKLPFN